MQQLIAEMCNSSMDELTIYEDNQSAIQMTKNPQLHGRAKYIGIKFHFIRELVSDGTVQLQYCPNRRYDCRYAYKRYIFRSVHQVAIFGWSQRNA